MKPNRIEPGWKQRALKKQLAFKARLGLTDSGLHGGKSYAHILGDKDAAAGANFYCYKDEEEWTDLQKWASRNRGKVVNFLNNGLKNLLRSEHIAYNVFYPLDKLRHGEPEKLNRLVESILSIDVSEVKTIMVEYAGEVHKKKLLDDNTSFDVFIDFLSNGRNCGAGIEIKYTEHSYPYGNTEKRRLFDNDSIYLKTAKHREYFINPESEILKSKKLKQPFRNHLLGIKMEESEMLDDFYSVHFYPEGNKYQKGVAKDYMKQINDQHKNRFISLTFKSFIEKVKAVGINGKWVDYFEQRYE